ncbi:hypothetical protein [Kitasatospora herbaricolor]|uniref:hypothetical protein n=1 Tax=Kitasatospora herbaricolor TaxID=68217 RepID=UPI0036DD4C22
MSEEGRRFSYRRLRRGLVTPELVSGTVLVSVVIAVADESGGVADVLAITLASMVVFWVTQVFILTIAAQQQRRDSDPVSLAGSLRFAVHRSNGLLLAAVPPLVFLVVGVFGHFEGQVAYWIALGLEVAILAALGWIAFAGRGIPWYLHVCGALATAMLGILAIGLKVLVS